MTMTTNGEPTPSEIQAEFYYEAFKSVAFPVWVRSCQAAATGEHWPSVGELKHAIRELTPAIQAPSVSQDGYLTKEEFGVNLYEAIVRIGGILAIQDQVNASVHLQKDLDVLVKKRDVLKAELIECMKPLRPDEEADIVKRYPIVAML